MMSATQQMASATLRSACSYHKLSTYAYKRTQAYRRQHLHGKILRVSHAGELGADKIYSGQMSVLGRSSVGPVINEMWNQEKEHLDTFETLIVKYQSRPSALSTLWDTAGFILGSGTALLGSLSAMACTVAVEEVITDHYNNQIRELMADSAVVNKELISILKKFRDDEQHHCDTGLEHNAVEAPFYKYLTHAIKIGVTGAICVAERI